MTALKMESDDNTGNLTLRTRDVDGETCLDVECGTNEAVLYVSKLFGGSKSLCILHGGQWMTPNEFQNVSGRRSAKDWKRSIRHHGVSLKTYMLSGLLELQDGGSSPANDGKDLTVGRKTHKVQRRKVKRKLKRKQKGGQPTVKNVCQTLKTEDKVPVSDSDNSNQNTDELCDILDEKTEDIDVALDNTEVDKDILGEQIHHEGDMNKEEDGVFETSDIKGDHYERILDDKADIHKGFELSDQCRQSSHLQKAWVHHIAESKSQAVHPYEGTVTPPPTPPHDVIKNEVDSLKVQSTHSKYDDKVSVFQGKMTIDYKPYLLHSSVGGQSDQNSKLLQSNIDMDMEVSQRNRLDMHKTQDTFRENKKGNNLMEISSSEVSVVSLDPPRETLHVTAFHKPVPQTTVPVPFFVRTKDSNSTIHAGTHYNSEDVDKSRNSDVTCSQAMTPYSHPERRLPSSPHSSFMSYNGCKCAKDLIPNPYEPTYDALSENVRVKSAQKRHHSEIYQEMPLDLSMKKKKTEEYFPKHVTETSSFDKNHVTNASACYDTYKKGHKRHQENMFTCTQPVVTPKNIGASHYPYLNPLTAMNFDHNTGVSTPCFCSLCVNPISLPVYVPFTWNLKQIF